MNDKASHCKQVWLKFSFVFPVIKNEADQYGIYNCILNILC